MDLPYFSVQAKKSQEQSAMLDASDPLDRRKMSKASSLLMIFHDDLENDVHLNEENLAGMLREVQSP